MRMTVGNVELNYRIDGPEGAPWLALGNSLATDLSLWDGQMAMLTRHFRVLRYDTRGHGGSSAPAGPYTFDRLVADLVGLLDGLGIERTHFMGMSLGGMTGLGFALAHPQRLGRLIVCDARADAPPAFVQGWDERIAVVQEKGIEALVEPTMQRWFTPAFIEAGKGLDKVRAMIRSTSDDGYIGCANALKGLDYRRHLGRIQAPALFVAGAQDLAAPPEAMRAMAEATPHSDYVEIPNAGHLSNLEQPDEFNRAVETFLARA